MDTPNIFTCYNPMLLRFPMQLILHSEDSSQLLKSTQSFTSRQHLVESLIIGNKAYIEYIPKSLADYADRAIAWEIRHYKAKYKL